MNSRAVVLVGLVSLLLVTPVWIQVNNPSLGLGWVILIGAAVPALLIYPVLKRTRNWSGITALCMIPFACIGIMEIVASLGTPDAGMAIAIISIATFFAALDAGRREPQNSH